jgi:hypothetical protein
MNKIVTVGMVAALAVGIATAQDEVVMVDQTIVVEEVSTTEVTLETSLLSAYVWRGQVINDGFVAQPQLSLAKGDFSLAVWGNYDLEENSAGSKNELSEIDITLAYNVPVDLNQFDFNVGLINYSFPNNGDTPSAESTTELFVSATLKSWDWMIPSLTVYGDTGNGDGTYSQLSVIFPYEFSEYLSVEGGFSVGYGSTSYNDYYFDNSGPFSGSKKDAGVNDYNVYLSAAYEIAENLTAGVNVTYTALDGGSIADAGNDIYSDDDQVWGGVNVAYDF